MRLRYVLAVLAGLVAWQPSVTQAQSLGTVISQILTIESERLFSESAFGKSIARQIEEDLAELAAENRSIEAELTAEEKSLTKQRPQMPPQDFRAVADAFDARVQVIRREQLNKELQISKRRDLARTDFLNAVQPVLEDLMRSSQAAVILEKKSTLFSVNAIDVTDQAIEQINQALGDGNDLGQSGDQ